MKKKSGVRIQNPEVKIHTIIQSEAFWLLDSGYFFMLGCVRKGHAGLYENGCWHLFSLIIHHRGHRALIFFLICQEIPANQNHELFIGVASVGNRHKNFA